MPAHSHFWMKAWPLALLVLAGSLPGTATAQDPVEVVSPYFKQRSEGWFWYRDPKAKSQPQPVVTPPVPPLALPPAAADPRDRIKAQREQLEKMQALAILEPTPDHIRAYLELHAKTLAQSAEFANAWQQVIWNTPSLDYTLQSPTGAAAYVKADVDTEIRTNSLATASAQYGLMFFFRSNCPYCHKFAPILKAFAERYGFNVLAVSLDGAGLPDYPNPAPNQGAAEAMKVDTVPAVFVVEPRGRAVAAASFGYLGFSELEIRVASAVNKLEKPAVSTPDSASTMEAAAFLPSTDQGLTLGGVPK